MKLGRLYRLIVETGLKHDARGPEEVRRLLQEEKKKKGELKGADVEFFDADRLFNPYADSRLLCGGPELEVRRVIVGVDMETPEILLTYVLNRDFKRKIDLIVSHHPEGRALARLADVMPLQADLLARFGVTVSVAEQLTEKRIQEVERRLMPINHARAVDAARLLGLPLLCAHTPADNCVTAYLQDLFDKRKPRLLKDILDILREIPEYRSAWSRLVPPKIVSGGDNNKCGKIYVDMTGGTEGAKEIFQKIAAGGVSTLVGMHISEEHLENAKKANLNIVIAGHISSDVLGLNLLFDEVEKEAPLDFVAASGFERVRRSGKRKS
ncbi:MAG: NGG1p interacting factor NIF3 [Candidatus Aminicenantes bacterium RBG_13_63_10]|nr:MAG: NGG1p interacting factor NIF3 [Candidatus Aminicenantes bacterium RBG_13_63_10]